MNPKVSIIIPVYNTADYLERCLDSVINQTFPDWECICIDDGSTDASAKICDAYAKKDGRFRVVHQTNRGISQTRQIGIDLAKGEWIAWSDSDDWMDPENIDHLVSVAKESNADFVWGDYWQDERRIDTKVCADDPKCLNVAILEGKTWGAVWNKLILRKFIVDHGVEFPDRRHDGEEDVCFICSILALRPRVCHTSYAGYHYFVRSNSLIHSARLDKESIRRVFVCRYVLSKLQDSDEKEALYRLVARVKDAMLLNDGISDEFYYEAFPEVKTLDAIDASVFRRMIFKASCNGCRREILMTYRLIKWLYHCAKKFLKHEQLNVK